MELGYFIYLLKDVRHHNPLFWSPLASSSSHILDLFTGTGGWVFDVAATYSGQDVHVDSVSFQYQVLG